jgi:hypothetical protein
MIDKIMSENPKIQNRCGKPPFVMSKLGQMGIADEPISAGTSFTSECAESIAKGLITGAKAMGAFNFTESKFNINDDKFLKPFYRAFIAEMEKKGFSKENFAFTQETIDKAKRRPGFVLHRSPAFTRATMDKEKQNEQ